MAVLGAVRADGLAAGVSGNDCGRLDAETAAISKFDAVFFVVFFNTYLMPLPPPFSCVSCCKRRKRKGLLLPSAAMAPATTMVVMMVAPVFLRVTAENDRAVVDVKGTLHVCS